MLEEHDEAKDFQGEEITRNSYVDPEEDIDQHSVTWRDLCGYFAVTFNCKTKEDSIKLFEALQLIIDYDVT